jgi:hypothetical protein
MPKIAEFICFQGMALWEKIIIFVRIKQLKDKGKSAFFCKITTRWKQSFSE